MRLYEHINLQFEEKVSIELQIFDTVRPIYSKRAENRQPSDGKR